MELQTDHEGDVVMRDESSLARQVFAIPELLEAILTALPIKHLLSAQRVATNWRDTIRDSKVLRRILFLEPTKNREIVAVMRGMCSHHEKQVSRQALEDNIYIESAPKCIEFDKFVPLAELNKDQYYCRTVALNPLLCTAQVLHERCNSLPINPIMTLHPNVEDGREYKGILHAISKYEHTQAASCTRMFLTQPPLTHVDFRLWEPAQQSLPLHQYFPDSHCRGDRVARTECCGVICCLDCVRRHRPLDSDGRRSRCPFCSCKFRSEDGITAEPFNHTGEGVRLADLLNAVATEWVRKEDGKAVYGGNVREATVGLYFRKGEQKDKFCVGTLVLSPDEWTAAQDQAARAG